MMPGLMRFSPNFLEAVIIEPIKYFFTNYAPPDYVYSTDINLNKIDISSITDFNKEALQPKPRILVDRGGFMIQGIGISDSMAEQESLYSGKGINNKKNMVLITGQAKIIVEARNRGACELITDIVTHLFVWSRPFICNSQGFKNLGMPMQVSPCVQSKEDTEIFQVTIDLPYVAEELWQVSEDAIKLKNIYSSMEAAAGLP